MSTADCEDIRAAIREAVRALSEHLEPGSLIVLGCSTSEIAGGRIGKASVPELGPVVAGAMIDACRASGMEPAFQCCEHLNRAVVMERDALRRRSYTQVCAVPQPKAGGSVPAAAWRLLSAPALALRVQAEAGIDIGDTLIGMHLRPVAVPLRIGISRVGEANLVLAYSRLPYIGGSRAVYE